MILVNVNYSITKPVDALTRHQELVILLMVGQILINYILATLVSYSLTPETPILILRNLNLLKVALNSYQMGRYNSGQFTFIERIRT